MRARRSFRRRRSVIRYCAAMAAGSCFTAAASAVASYDSGGFDTTSRFSTSFSGNDAGVTGTLRGQDSGVDTWFFSTSNTGLPASSTGTAKVITSTGGTITGGAVFSGTQAVRVDRISADNRWGPVYSIAPAAVSNVVKVTWEMNTAVGTFDGSHFGPFFGVEGYANNSGGVLGGAGMDAATGEVVYEDPTSGITGLTIPTAGWHLYEMDFNYQSGTYAIRLDNSILKSGVSFLTTGVNAFVSAPIAALVDAPPLQAIQTGTAYFDNYAVTTGPVVAQWGLATGGSWNLSGSWAPNGVPNGAVDRASFASSNSAPAVVTLDANQTVGQLTFSSGTAYTINAGAVSHTLTIDDTGDTGGASPSITVSAGSHTINAPVALAGGVTVSIATSTALAMNGNITGAGGLTKTGTGSLTLGGADNFGNTTVSAGTLTLASGASLASTTITNASGATLNVNGSVAAGATINANGTVNFSGTTGSSSITRAFTTLAIGNGATTKVLGSTQPFFPSILYPTTLSFGDANSKLDLTNNELLVTMPLATLMPKLNSAIFTSTPQLGYALGTLDLGSNVTEVRFTLKGDANLDGTVGVGDLGALATNYGKTTGGTWSQGDSDGNGTVDVADLGALATNYGTSLAGGPSAGAATTTTAALAIPLATTSSTAVPEPTALALAALSATTLTRRRPRRR